MKNSTREALSAILDGEGSEFEVRRTLTTVESEDSASFGRWQLARDVIRRQAVGPVPSDFADGVLARIRTEQQDDAGTKRLLLARVAVVATVAFATVVGFQYWTGPEQAVDHFTALNAAEDRLSDFSGEVSPVSKSLEPQKQLEQLPSVEVQAVPEEGAESLEASVEPVQVLD